jgi:pilus assembly protein CpaC
MTNQGKPNRVFRGQLYLAAGLLGLATTSALFADSTAQLATSANAKTHRVSDSTSPATSYFSPNVISEGLDADGNLKLAVNQSRMLVTAAPLRNAQHDGAAVASGSSEIFVAEPLSADTLLITAKKPGSSNMIIEDEIGRRQLVSVVVEPDLAPLREQLSSLGPNASIEVTDANGNLVLRGHVPNLQTAQRAEQLATAYYPGANRVVDLLEVSGGQQVMLEVKFAEVSRTVESQLGINFGYTDGTSIIGNNIGGVNPFATSGGVPGSALQLLSQSPASNIQLFADASFARGAMAYFLNCLHENELMRTLAEPNLTVISGEAAQFQVGGEIPIPVPQQSSSGGGTTITIEYKDFGVLLHATPVVLGNGRIRLKVNPEVSNIDESNAVTLSGFSIPAFTTRTVDTTVELSDGQTFAIAGLLNNQTNATIESIPGLGDLPGVGVLFRTVQYQRTQDELVVMVTPHLVEPLNPEQVPTAPGEKWRSPSEADLFIDRDLGGDAGELTTPPSPSGSSPSTAHATSAPQFRGEYGFVPTADTRVVAP